MTFSSSKFSVCLFGLACAIAVGGCAQTAAHKRHYILEAVRQDEPAETQTDVVLEVHRFTIDAAFAGKALVYRRDQLTYESDFYHEFLVAPAVMITEKARLWLARSGLVARVLTPGSRLEASHTLEGNITQLYGDFSDPSTAQAVLELHCFLLANENADETIVFGKVYGASIPLEAQTADALVEALDQCLIQIFERLEDDLQQSLADSSGSSG
jgi:ABC-type uncharacterized transport system auxiliary subunit